MIKVNLLATSPGSAPKRDWFPQEQRSGLIGLGLLVLTAVSVGGYWFYLQHTQRTLDTRIVSAEAQLVRLKDAAKLVDQTTARRTELTERLALIERLRAAKRGPVSLLETVSRSIPDGLWLIEMKQTGTAVQIDGRAMSLTAVSDFAKRMQNSGAFQGPVEILTTTTETVEQMDLVRFSVKAEATDPRKDAAGQNPTTTTGAGKQTSITATPGHPGQSPANPGA